MGKRRVSDIVAACVCAAIAFTVGNASASKGAWEEYDQLIRSSEAISALGPTLFGDQSNLQNGGLGFSVTDVSLRGNNSLPVAVTRTFKTKTAGGAMRGTLPSTNKMDAAMGDWDIDLPFVGGVFAQSTGWINSAYGKAAQRCSVANSSEAAPQNLTVGTSSFAGHNYWHGTRINIPGHGSQAILVVNASSPRPTGSNAYWTTSDFTSVACLPSIQNASGEGFIATTADGTRYWFNWMAMAHEQELTQQRETTGYDHLPRGAFGLYATRVEDRFGNWVTYSYTNAANAPARVSEINSSDGRGINVSYNAAGFVNSVVSNGRTWSYGYSSGTSGALTSVLLPDGSSWSINLAGFQSLLIRYLQGEPGEQWRNCGNPGDVAPRTYVGAVTHPSGAIGEFTLEIQRFVRNGVDYAQNCALGNLTDSNDDTEWYPTAWDSYALMSKRLTGPGLTPATWSYVYSMGYSTEVFGPGDYTRYTYGNTFRQDEGKLLLVERGSGSTQILNSESYTYELAQSGMPYPTPIGVSPQIRSDDFGDEYLRPEKQRAITQQGVTFNSTVNTADGYARPLSVYKASSLGYGKTDVTEYYDDSTKWVLGQVKHQVNADTGLVMAQSDYDPATALPIRNYSFGKLTQTIGYNGDGTVAAVTDGRNYTTTLSNWKRGIPQTVQYHPTAESPAGATQSAIVSDSGWVTSVTDENGFATGYSYDAMGRLASIAYPTADTTIWNNVALSFQQIGFDEHGLPAGHWRSSRYEGDKHVNTYYDAMWRPVLEEALDASNIAGTLSQTVKTYDASGRLAFQSYPQRGVGNYWDITQGTRTSYDALDRVTQVKQDSELGVLTSTTEYLPGFQTRSSNPRGYQSVTQYQTFDEPATTAPTGITMPEGAATEIYRHPNLGRVERITRRNADGSLSATRQYVYDGYQQLCKVIEPETGATVMAYDAAGNLEWSAAGLSLPDAAQCNIGEAWASGRQVQRSYNARNRIATLGFPGNNGNQTWSYTPDGLPSQIAVNNIGVGTTFNRYTYNKRRLLTGESSAFAGVDWGLGYGYDANGALASLVYPNGVTVDYAPNALGQPTRAGPYASGVSYYPNGAIQQFTYGNGIVHTMAQNARQLPARSTDSGGALDHEYVYDGNANVQYIYDWRNPADHRYLYYDGLDRLTSAGSQMFGGDHWHRFTYDALDNLKSWKLAGVKDYANYYYDPASQRLTNIQNSAGTSIVGLGYDVQGNLANKNGQTYNFDYGNRLREVGGLEWYAYDGHGRRILNCSPTACDYQQYGLDGKPYFHIDNRKGRRYNNIYLAGSVVAIRDAGAWDEASPQVRYQHTDALGSPVAVTNEAGTVIDRTQYEPYGAAIGKPAYDGVGYTGHVMDGATGLTYMQQRYYDPGIGRFLSVDPVTANSNTGANFNRYHYANNNPYRFTDPDGRQPRCHPNCGASFVGESVSGVDVNSAASLGMANIPRSWKEPPSTGKVNVGAVQPDRAPVARKSPNWFQARQLSHGWAGRISEVNVDVNSLDFTGLTNDKWGPDGTKQFTFPFSNLRDFPVHGTVTISNLGGGRFTVESNQYDNNIQWNNGFSLRNVLTGINGALHCCVMEPYDFHFVGERSFYDLGRK